MAGPVVGPVAGAEAATLGTFVLGVVLMGGTSMIGTLLGPEGSDGVFRRCRGAWFLVALVLGCLSGIPPLHHLWCGGWCSSVGWLSGLLFENCIVDASIFF